MLTSALRLLLSRSVKPFVFSRDYDYKLCLDVENLGVYVHIPFCETICTFCPYNKVKYNSKVADNFVEALIREIRLSGEAAKGGREVTCVYFGGGSPALLADRLSSIIDEIKCRYRVKGNIGIELHPGDIDRETIDKLKHSGINMASVGVQSFQEKCLAALGREAFDIKGRLQELRKAEFNAIDVDLIFGIPGQTGEELRQDFITAVESGATQISTYPFIDFSYANNPKKPLGRKQKKAMLEILLETSREMGCERTSVWTFAKKGTPKYSSITRDNFIGFGPSATTLLKDIFKINTFSVEAYIECVSRNRIPTALMLRFNERTRALYWLFWSSYNMLIDNDSFYSLFGRRIEEIFSLELFAAMKLNYIKKVEKGYVLTEKGAYMYHLVEQAYTHQYIDKTWKIARNEPWPEEIILY